VIDENVPVDYRDAKRYAAVAMLLKTRGKEIREQAKDEGQRTKDGAAGEQEAQRSGSKRSAIARHPYAGREAGSTCHENR
jgi:hypothetical protein